MLPFLPNEIVDKINNMVYEIELQEHKDKFKSSIEWINKEYEGIVKCGNPEISFKNQEGYGIPMRMHEEYTICIFHYFYCLCYYIIFFTTC